MSDTGICPDEAVGASSEAALAQMKTISKDLRVAAAMVTQFQTLPLSATLNEATEALMTRPFRSED